MAADLGPGDLVECIDTRGFPTIVRIGAVYLVEHVGESCGVPSLVLEGVRHPKGWRWVRMDCFRLVSKRGDFNAILAQLKRPIPEDVQPRVPERV